MIALLIRHAETDAVGRRLTGRLPGVFLTAAGQRQAQRLTSRAALRDVSVLYASPQVRAHQTAAPLAAARGLEVQEEAALDEVDFGAWSGRELVDLDTLPAWQAFNAHRAAAAAPGGERMTDVQARVVTLLESLRAVHPEETVALVSHAEVIRSAVLHYLAMSLDLFGRIEIGPASITVLEMSRHGPRFLAINEIDRTEDERLEIRRRSAQPARPRRLST